MKRRVTTILAGDVVGFSRLVAEDENETLQRLSASHRIFDESVTRHGGRVFNMAGDSIMWEFESALDAVQAAIEIQEALRAWNLSYAPHRWLQFRNGMSTGEVVERDRDLLGMAVNIAARLEKLAKPGGICISQGVHEAVSGKLAVPFIDLGENQLKNIPRPVHAFAVAWPGTEISLSPPATGRLAGRRPLWAAGLAGLFLVTGGGIAAGLHFSAWGEPRHIMGGVSSAQQAAQAYSLTQDHANTFAGLSQKGGLIDDPQSAPGLYHKALLFEAKGQTSGAHRAYYALARLGLEFIDPHLRYAALVRDHEGEATAREVYAELHEDVPTRATVLVHALQFDGAARRAKIKALVADHPDFAPAYYFLAEEHSEERAGRWRSMEEKQAEFAALSEFLRADREGRLARFFLDQTVAADWLDQVRERHGKLEIQFKSASAEGP